MPCDSITAYWILWAGSGIVAVGPIIASLFFDSIAERVHRNIGVHNIRWVLVLAGLANLLVTLRLISAIPCLD